MNTITILVCALIALAPMSAAASPQQVIDGEVDCAYLEDGAAGCTVSFAGPSFDDIQQIATFTNRARANAVLGMTGAIVQQSKATQCGYTADVKLQVSRIGVEEDGGDVSTEMQLDKVLATSGLKLNANPSEDEFGHGECKPPK